MRKKLITEHSKMSHTGQISTMNEMNEGMEVQIYAFLISALCEMRWQLHATEVLCLGKGVTIDTIQYQLVFVSNNAGS